MYYDEEDNNKDTGIGENPLIPQEPEQNSPESFRRVRENVSD